MTEKSDKEFLKSARLIILGLLSIVAIILVYFALYIFLAALIGIGLGVAGSHGSETLDPDWQGDLAVATLACRRASSHTGIDRSERTA